ncbi:MAG: class I SAM-dependent methyltransferase [Thiobacillus sp.]
MNAYKNYFSSQSDAYAAHRPTYPPALFAWLASQCTERDQAWDCATGNGQAALALAEHFNRVIGTDASAEQISHAALHPKLHYRVSTAEQSSLPGRSLDLVTVAQAAHWFDLPRFYDEAARVLKPNGVIAIWAYGLVSISPLIDIQINQFYRETLGPYWPPERAMIDEGYRSLPFPFNEIPAPQLTMRADWSLDALIAYLGTWSAVKCYRAACNEDPLPRLRTRLLPDWDNPALTSTISWPLYLRVGRL